MLFSRSLTSYRPVDEADTSEYYENRKRGSIIVLRFSWLSLYLTIIMSLLALAAAFAAGIHQAQPYSLSEISSIMKGKW